MPVGVSSHHTLHFQRRQAEGSGLCSSPSLSSLLHIIHLGAATLQAHLGTRPLT